MPEQLALATIHALQDELIALFNGERSSRKWIIDPSLLHGDSSIGWADDTDSLRSYPEAAGSAAGFAIPVPVNEGDRVVEVKINVYQESGTALTVHLYSVDSSGARTSRGSASTPGGSGADAWHELTITVGYTVGANVSICIGGASAVQYDKIGGGYVEIDHP